MELIIAILIYFGLMSPSNGDISQYKYQSLIRENQQMIQRLCTNKQELDAIVRMPIERVDD